MQNSPQIKTTSIPPAKNAAASNHFGTDHLLGNLKQRSVRGGILTLSAQAVKFFLQTGSTMALARLLTPADFGLVAMVTSITGFVAMFKDAGLSMATVQRAEITHTQVSALFWINIALSFAVALIVAGLAPLIALFYHEQRLVWITITLAGTFIFSGLTVQHQALLRRQMRFKDLAIIEVLSMLVGIGTAIIMAIFNFSYWSLVGLTVGTTLSNCALVWKYSSWRPSFILSGSKIRSMLRFGGGLTGFSALNYFTRNADNVIIGFCLGSVPLGIYSKAYNLLMMPIRQINGPAGSVMVPSLSRLQREPERYRRAYLRAVSTLALIGMPMVALLFTMADEAVLIVLGPRWEGAATVFRLLAPAALLGTVNVAPGWLCVSLGRAKIQVIWAAISAPITVIGFIVGVHWGIAGVATSFSITWCALLLVFMAMSCHNSPVKFSRVIKAFFPALLASIVATVCCFLFFPLIIVQKDAVFWSITIKTLIFLIIYFLIICSISSTRERLQSLWSDGLNSFLHQ